MIDGYAQDFMKWCRFYRKYMQINKYMVSLLYQYGISKDKNLVVKKQ